MVGQDTLNQGTERKGVNRAYLHISRGAKGEAVQGSRRPLEGGWTLLLLEGQIRLCLACWFIQLGP